MRQKSGTVLCAYYVCENIHGLVGPPKGWTDWEEEVSKLIPKVEEMRDKLIPKEKIMAIQEQLSGFIVEQVLDPKGEFYYDGLSNIDNRSKYDNIRVYI